MSNEGNIRCGLDPLPDNNGQVEVRSKVPVSAAINQIPLFRGSPYQMSLGSVVGTDWSSDPTQACAGCVTKLYDSTGAVEVLNLPEDEDGYADVTYRRDQRYQILVSGSGFSDSGDTDGTTFGLTQDTSTASANGFDGDCVSAVMLDSGQQDPAANTFLASFKVAKPRNIGGADRTLIEGTINPVCHQAW